MASLKMGFDLQREADLCFDFDLNVYGQGIGVIYFESYNILKAVKSHEKVVKEGILIYNVMISKSKMILDIEL